MGLAQKMAALQAGAPAGGSYPQQYPPSGAPYSNQPPPGQYQAYPGGHPQGQPSQGQYGAPAAPNQQSYGRPPPQSALSPATIKQSLSDTIQEKAIQSLFRNPALLDQISQSAVPKVQQICQEWRLPMEVAMDIVKLALFDIVLYIDDSGSMAFEENGERINDMKLIVARAAYAASLFDADGIDVRFMNSDVQGTNIRSEQQVEALIASVKFKGLTPMGTQLRAKVIEPLVVRKARANQLEKPVLIIVITDGQPAGEPNGAVFDAIKYASDCLAQTQYGKGAVSFQFAQVGNDLKAREFLGKLDDEPGIGELVDCTSNFEVEQDEMARAVPPIDLTPDLWLMKLLLGAIDSSYDTKDEKGSRPSPAYPPPGHYGQPSYPPQQGSYPPHQGPPPGQYGQPYGAPPSQNSGQQQYGGPPPQHGGQQPYGAPPIPPRY